MKTFAMVNALLFVLIIFLGANLIQPLGTITGNVIYGLDGSDPKCYFNSSGEMTEIPIDGCCYDIENQITCKPTGLKDIELKCYISEASDRNYLINHKALYYCAKAGYDVKAE